VGWGKYPTLRLFLYFSLDPSSTFRILLAEFLHRGGNRLDGIHYILSGA